MTNGHPSSIAATALEGPKIANYLAVPDSGSIGVIRRYGDILDFRETLHTQKFLREQLWRVTNEWAMGHAEKSCFRRRFGM
jgi:hypothetical protein